MPSKIYLNLSPSLFVPTLYSSTVAQLSFLFVSLLQQMETTEQSKRVSNYPLGIEVEEGQLTGSSNEVLVELEEKVVFESLP